MNTSELLADLRRRGAETTQVEVKSAANGLPRSIVETLSAFANGSGGTILLGVNDDLTWSSTFDARACRDALAGRASDDLDPPIRGDIDIEEIDGHLLVRFDVDELPPFEKPCFVKTKGKYGGSYIRSGDGDRKLTNYEVDRLVENRAQPHHDRELVVEASLDDLDPEFLDPYLSRLRARQPRAFQHLSRTELVRTLDIARPDDTGSLRPTLAALLVFGTYPQRYFPQLFASVVVLPNTVMGDPGPAGERFLDNRSVEGPLPALASEAVAALVRNMRRTAVMQGAYRVEQLEYPIEVVRELIVNALIHRDYSPLGRQSQVQIELYPDRLVVRNVGGLHGTVRPQDFGGPGISCSRNELLSKLLSDVAMPNTDHMVAENRGSGIPSVMRTLYRAGMAPPVFRAEVGLLEVTVPHHALLTPDVQAWIDSLAADGLSSQQRQALALMRDGHPVRNATLQGWGLHRADATRELGDLVQRGLAEKVGDRRGASYRLGDRATPTAAVAPAGSTRALSDRIMHLFDRGTSLTAREIQDLLGTKRGVTLAAINALIAQERLEATAPPRSTLRAYRLTGRSPR